MIDAVWMRIRHFLRGEQGPAAVEYAVMLMLIILAMITVIQTIGQWTAGSL